MRRNRIEQRGINTTHVINNKGQLGVFRKLDICLFELNGFWGFFARVDWSVITQIINQIKLKK